jgi:predicted nucleic acid-binding protein
MHSKNNIKAVLDTNAIHPILIRDILFWMMHHEIFTGYWSEEILGEWRALLQKIYPSENIAHNRIEQIKQVFPESLVPLKNKTTQLNLPDEKDNHILQLAIETESLWILTFNLKDFPDNILIPLGIKAANPDDFISQMIRLNPIKTRAAFKDLIQIKRNPPLTNEHFILRLQNNNLMKTFEAFQTLL